MEVISDPICMLQSIISDRCRRASSLAQCPETDDVVREQLIIFYYSQDNF